jgi:NAD(P)H-dependent FMN reductase
MRKIDPEQRKETSMSDIKVLTLVGSLRAASVNRQIAGLAAQTAPAGITVDVYQGLGGGLGELPLSNENIDNAADLPASASTLRGAVAEADAILVVTPEYNGSIPGGLKNAIDWLSRPYGHNALSAKPLAVVGASMGQYGGVQPLTVRRDANGESCSPHPPPSGRVAANPTQKCHQAAQRTARPHPHRGPRP